MNLVPYNRLISRRDLEEYIAGKFEIMDYVNLGFYIFMSRVFQPAFVAPDQPSHKHPVNKTAQRILEMGVGMEAFKDVDYAGVYILRKK